MSLSVFTVLLKFVNVSFCVVVLNFNCFYHIMQFFEYQHDFFANI